MYFKDETAAVISQLGEKQAKQLRAFEISRIIDKLIEKEIEDEEIDLLILHIKDLLIKLQNGERKLKKTYLTAQNNLKEQVRKKYKLAPKDYYSSLYLSFGLSIGTALGVVLMTAVNSAFLAVGIGCGLSIGVAIGQTKEKEARSKGLLY